MADLLRRCFDVLFAILVRRRLFVAHVEGDLKRTEESDREFGQRLGALFEARLPGRVFVAKRDIPNGADWKRAIDGQLSSCWAGVVVCTPSPSQELGRELAVLATRRREGNCEVFGCLVGRAAIPEFVAREDMQLVRAPGGDHPFEQQLASALDELAPSIRARARVFVLRRLLVIACCVGVATAGALGARQVIAGADSEHTETTTAPAVGVGDVPPQTEAPDATQPVLEAVVAPPPPPPPPCDLVVRRRTGSAIFQVVGCSNGCRLAGGPPDGNDEFVGPSRRAAQQADAAGWRCQR